MKLYPLLFACSVTLAVSCATDDTARTDPPQQDASVPIEAGPTVDGAVDVATPAPVPDAAPTDSTPRDASVPRVDAGMSPPRANVVLIVADDLGWNDVGYHGSEIETPRIDQIVREGVALDRFYTFPLCGPTRKGLLTGRSPITIGVIGNPRPNDQDSMPLDEHLISESFQAAGYQTWLTGKWHLGGATLDDYLPQRRGFDHFYGHVGAFIDYYTHIRRRGSDIDWQRNGETIDEMGYTTDLLTDEALSLIAGRDPSRPFFLYLAYNAVHTPLMAPADLIDKYSFIDDSARQTYAAMAEAMDTNIGRVMDALAEAGLDESTLVVFHSDNGGDIARGGASNTPFRGAKSQVFEGGIRVAGALRWPGVIAPGRTSRQFFSVLDVFPTVASAVGVAPQNARPLDGRDLWDAIQRDELVPPEEYVVVGSGYAIIHGDWKLIDPQRGQPMLFRIEADAEEANDVSGENPDVVADLQARLDRITADLP